MFVLFPFFQYDNIIRFNVIFPKLYYELFLVNFVNMEDGWIFIKYNGVSIISGNCKNEHYVHAFEW